MRLSVAALAAALILSAALAHDDGPGAWINHEHLRDPATGAWCCNLIDCREEPDNVEPAPDG